MELPKLTKVSENKKKKVIIFSDDLRMSSGVGTMSREIVFGTLDKYDWYQVGGAIKHPEKGKLIDMNDVVRKETGIEDANLKGRVSLVKTFVTSLLLGVGVPGGKEGPLVNI